jgi:hypothetical protein
MQYAVLTRDYTNDYRWSWATRGNDFPLAEISQSLKSQIPDGEKGIVVSFENGNFHILLASLDKLGEKTNGKDSENRNFYVYLVFSYLSQEEVKGLVRYYYQNWENPGKAFVDIVHWNDDNKSWELIEDKIIETFNNIPKGTISGKILVQKNANKNESQKENNEPVDWLDYDLSEKNGVKIIMRSGSVKITVDEMPVIDKIVIVYKNIGWFSIICVLLFVALGIAVYVARDYSIKNGVLEIKNGAQQVKLLNYNALEKELLTVKQDNEKLKKRPTEKMFDEIQQQLLERTKDMSKFAESLQKEGEKLRVVEKDRDKYKGILDGIDYEKPQTHPLDGRKYYWGK